MPELWTGGVSKPAMLPGKGRQRAQRRECRCLSRKSRTAGPCQREKIRQSGMHGVQSESSSSTNSEYDEGYWELFTYHDAV